MLTKRQAKTILTDKRSIEQSYCEETQDKLYIEALDTAIRVLDAYIAIEEVVVECMASAWEREQITRGTK